MVTKIAGFTLQLTFRTYNPLEVSSWYCIAKHYCKSFIVFFKCSLKDTPFSVNHSDSGLVCTFLWWASFVRSERFKNISLSITYPSLQAIATLVPSFVLHFIVVPNVMPSLFTDILLFRDSSISIISVWSLCFTSSTVVKHFLYFFVESKSI